MGKGDRKTKRGKITLGTYGARRRSSKAKKTTSAEKAETPRIEKAPERVVPPRKKLKTPTNH